MACSLENSAAVLYSPRDVPKSVVYSPEEQPAAINPQTSMSGTHARYNPRERGVGMDMLEMLEASK